MARGAVKVVSINGALTVTFTAASGATPTVFSDEACTSTTALPATISDGANTIFYFASPGSYTLSVKTSSGVQIAGDLNSTKVVTVAAGDVGVYAYDTRLVSRDASGDSGRHSPGTDLATTYASLSAANSLAGQQTFLGGAVRGDPAANTANEWLQSAHTGWTGDKRWQNGIDTSNDGGGIDYFFAKAAWRTVTDAATTSSSPTLTSASALFGSEDVGQPVTGSGIPASTYVGIVNSPTSIGLSSSSGSNVPVNATASATGVQVQIGTAQAVGDVWMWRHNGGDPASLGVGAIPPDSGWRMTIAASPSKASLGALLIALQAGQTGDALTIRQSNGSTKNLFIDPNGVVSGQNGQGLKVKADATNNRGVTMQDNSGAQEFGWLYTGSGFISFRNITGGANLLTFATNGDTQIGKAGAGMGFYGAAAAAKPTVTGSKGANAALTSLLTALAGLGLLTDSST